MLSGDAMNEDQIKLLAGTGVLALSDGADSRSLRGNGSCEKKCSQDGEQDGV